MDIIACGGNSWTTFVKEWAKKKGMRYRVAIKDPEASAAYKAQQSQKKVETKQNDFETLKEVAVELATAVAPPEPKKTAGRPKKYATEEEAKAAKKKKTLESTQRKRKELKEKKEAGDPEAILKHEQITDANVARTTKMRGERRAKEVLEYEDKVMKMINYREEKLPEWKKLFDADPFSPYSFDNMFGDEGERASAIQKKTLEMKLPPNMYDLEKVVLGERLQEIPNYYSGAYELLKRAVEEQKDYMYSENYGQRRRQEKEMRGMLEEDFPELERRRIEKEERDRQREEDRKARDEKERKRRAALTPAERAAEDQAARDYAARFFSGRGRNVGKYVVLKPIEKFWAD